MIKGIFPYVAIAEEKDPGKILEKEVMEKIVRAYGGSGALEKITTSFSAGRNSNSFSREEGLYVRYMSRNRKLTVEINYGSSSEKRILNGGKGYRGSGHGRPSPVTGPQFLAMVYQYKYTDLPYGLSKGLYRVSLREKDVFEGREVYIMDVNDEEGPDMRVWVDRVTHLILKVSGYFNFGGTNTDLTALFSDYRKVGDTVFPFRITNMAGGHIIGETFLEHILLNHPISETIFEP